jgi:hypothetical protein
MLLVWWLDRQGESEKGPMRRVRGAFLFASKAEGEKDGEREGVTVRKAIPRRSTSSFLIGLWLLSSHVLSLKCRISTIQTGSTKTETTRLAADGDEGEGEPEEEHKEAEERVAPRRVSLAQFPPVGYV